MGERSVRIREVMGSNPTVSTKISKGHKTLADFTFSASYMTSYDLMAIALAYVWRKKR